MDLDCGESELCLRGRDHALAREACTTQSIGLPVFLGISRATDCAAEGGEGAALGALGTKL